MPLDAASTVRSNAYRKTAWRLMPFLMLCYLCAYLDRVNVGFAKLQMMNDLSLSETVYGLGAGMFFIGYFLCEVPSNLILHKVGARRWIARIMISWGIISALFAFVETAWQFYVLRFLLGIAEAGLAPGLLLYLTYWFPSYRRARMTVLWFVAIPLSGMIGGPLSGWIMNQFAGVHGWAGWQWMFVLEAIPTVIVGLLVLSYLKDGVHQATWLTDEEKTLIKKELAEDNSHKVTHASPREFISDSRLPMSGMAAYTPGMEITGGSLGHGLGIAVGACLGLKRKKSDSFVYNLLSDGELNEGSTWEAAMSASHWKLDNLIAIIDVNNQQADGHSSEVLAFEPILDRWQAFGWFTQRVDGNDIEALVTAFDAARSHQGPQPRVIICDTKMGKGVDFLESREKTHFIRVDEHEWNLALKNLKVGRTV